VATADRRSAPASTTFLFDRARTGRSPFAIGDLPQPEILWRCRLPNDPPMCPESTPVFDGEGNLYFGCHDACIYSVTASGELRWRRPTGNKVYSSPTIVDDRLILIASGTGELRCLDREGSLVWSHDLCDLTPLGVGPRRVLHRLRARLQRPYYHAKLTTRCWASPNVDARGNVYITGFGIGLHALRAEDGELLWVHPLGGPGNHLSGVAIDSTGRIYAAAQRDRLTCIDRDGNAIWSRRAPSGFDAWGNPSLDETRRSAYFTLSRRDREGRVVATELRGDLRWEARLPGGVLGSAAVHPDGQLLVASLNGRLYRLDASSGEILGDPLLGHAERGMWTTPAIDAKGRILVSTKTSWKHGALHCLSAEGEPIWKVDLGKALSTPVVDARGRIYVGTWDGEMVCLQS
jgi:outer membrane protein assembly factor BamB